MNFRIGLFLKRLVYVALAGLVIFLIARSWRNAHNAEEPVSDDAAGTAVFDELTLTEIAYSNADTTLTFIRDAEDGLFYWSTSRDFPLDRTRLEKTERDLAALSPVLVTEEADEELLETYGLDNPTYAMQATYSDGTVLSFTLGNATDEGNYYMRYADEERTAEVYTVGSGIALDMAYGIYDMYLLETLPSFTEETLVSVAVNRGDVGKLYRMRQSGSGDSTHYTWFLGGNSAEDQPGVADLTETLSRLAFSSCAVWKPTKKTLSVCGLTKPAASVEIVYKDTTERERTFAFRIGNAYDDAYFIYAEGMDAVYTMSGEMLKPFLQIAGFAVEKNDTDKQG